MSADEVMTRRRSRPSSALPSAEDIWEREDGCIHRPPSFRPIRLSAPFRPSRSPSRRFEGRPTACRPPPQRLVAVTVAQDICLNARRLHHRPPSFALFDLRAGHRRADPRPRRSSSHSRRQLCSRRHPPQRLPPCYPRPHSRICLQTQRRLHPPSLVIYPICLGVPSCLSRLPSRNSPRLRRCCFRSPPTSLQPTPSPQRLPSCSRRCRCRSHLQTRRGAASDAPLEFRCLVRSYAPAGCRRATHVDLEGAPSALRRHLCSRRRPPIGARRPRPAADAEAVCKREEGRLPTPLLNSVALFALTRQPVAVAQLT